MKNTEICAYLTELQSRISGGNVEELDFDLLAARLGDVVALIERFEVSESELAVLREDFCRRIAGMAKAIAVAERKNGNLQEADELIASLESLSAPQLIEQYRRIQARFHDAFPSSFGLLRNKAFGAKSENYRAYK